MYYSITLNASTSIKNAVETTFKHIDFIPFTFVRNPYSRVVSMWNRYREENSTNITFDSFVNLLVSEKTLKHYHRNQIDVLSDADIQYMGYVEQIKVDMHRLILLCDPGQLTCFDNLSDLKIPRCDPLIAGTGLARSQIQTGHGSIAPRHPRLGSLSEYKGQFHRNFSKFHR